MSTNPGSMMPGMNSSDTMMSMHMSFYWGKDLTILFANWPGQSLGMYVLALLFIFILSAGVEVLSVPPTKKPSAFSLLTQSCIYGVRMALAYMVMLSVMSYNFGIFIVAIVGHTVGSSLDKIRASRYDDQSSTDNNGPKV